jgi:hypothetical protein
VFNFPTISLLIEMVSADKTLRRLCGWQRAGEVPSEATFSRAFAAFAASALPSRLHQALIKETHADRLAGHISRDSTAIEAREKPAKPDRPGPVEQPKRKRGRPRKGDIRHADPPRRIERQLGMSLTAMLADLPRYCDVGTKRNAKGYQGERSTVERVNGGLKDNHGGRNLRVRGPEKGLLAVWRGWKWSPQSSSGARYCPGF